MRRSKLSHPLPLALAAMLASTLSLTACGGGGSSGGGNESTTFTGPAPTTPPAPPATPPTGGGTPPPSGGGGQGTEGGSVTPPPGGPQQPVVPGPAAGPTVLATLPGARALATVTGDGTLYAVDGQGGLWRKGADEENAQPLYSLGMNNVEGLAYAAAGNQVFLTINGSQLGRFRLDDLAFVHVGAFPGYVGVRGLEVDAQSGRLYGVDGPTRTLLEIDPATAAVTAIGTLPSAYADVQGLAMDPLGRVLYATDLATGRLLEIDPADASVVERTRLPRASLAGLGYVVTGDRFLAVDSDTGEVLAWDAKGHDILLSTVAGLDYDAQGRRVVGVHQGQAMLVSIDPVSGWKSWIGWTGVGGLESLAVDGASGFAYAVDAGRKMLVRLQLSDGRGTDVGPLSGALGSTSDVAGMAFDPAAGVLYGIDAASGSIVRISTANGSATVAASLGLTGVRSLAFEPGRRLLHAFDDATRTHLRIDPVGFSVVQEPVPGFGPMGGLAFDAERGILWGTDLPTASLVRVWQEPAAPSLGYDDVTALTQVGAQLVGFDAATDSLITVDPVTGAGSPLASLPAFDLEALTVHPVSGQMLASDVRTGTLVRVEPGSGQVSLVGAIGYADVRGLAFDPANGTLFGVDRATRALIQIDPLTGAGTFRMDLSASGLNDLQDLAYDPSTQLLIAVDAGLRLLVEIDPVASTVREIGVIEPADVRALLVESPGVLAAIDRATDRLIRLDRFSGATLP